MLRTIVMVAVLATCVEAVTAQSGYSDGLIVPEAYGAAPGYLADDIMVPPGAILAPNASLALPAQISAPMGVSTAPPVPYQPQEYFDVRGMGQMGHQMNQPPIYQPEMVSQSGLPYAGSSLDSDYGNSVQSESCGGIGSATEGDCGSDCGTCRGGHLRGLFGGIGDGKLAGRGCRDFQRTFSAWGGYNWLTDRGDDFVPAPSFFDEDFAVGLSLGRQMNRFSRIEMEGSFRNAKSFQGGPLALPVVHTRGEANVYAGMVNFIIDLPSFGRFQPYGGAGMGYAFLDGDLSFAGDLEFLDSSAFAYQAIGGVNVAMCRRASLFVEYRFFSTEDFRTGTPVTFSNGASGIFNETEGPFEAHNLVGGLRFVF